MISNEANQLFINNFSISPEKTGVWLIERKVSGPCIEAFLWSRALMEVFQCDGNLAKDMETENRLGEGI